MYWIWWITDFFGCKTHPSQIAHEMSCWSNAASTMNYVQKTTCTAPKKMYHQPLLGANWFQIDLKLPHSTMQALSTQWRTKIYYWWHLLCESLFWWKRALPIHCGFLPKGLALHGKARDSEDELPPTKDAVLTNSCSALPIRMKGSVCEEVIGKLQEIIETLRRLCTCRCMHAVRWDKRAECPFVIPLWGGLAWNLGWNALDNERHE